MAQKSKLLYCDSSLLFLSHPVYAVPMYWQSSLSIFCIRHVLLLYCTFAERSKSL